MSEETNWLSNQELISLADKVAIITGGAMGVGAGIARRLHEAGANVVVADLDVEAGDAIVGELNTLRTGTAAFVRTNVADDADVSELVRTTVEQFGRLNVLVNNAGIFPHAPILESDRAHVVSVLDVNVIGPYLLMKEAAGAMIAQQTGGRIINITSINAFKPVPGRAIYSASKSALLALTKAAAMEFSEHRITVNALGPGGVITPGSIATTSGPMASGDAIPLGRRANPDDMSRAALFLASEMAAYMTGAHVVVDGGLTLV